MGLISGFKQERRSPIKTFLKLTGITLFVIWSLCLIFSTFALYGAVHEMEEQRDKFEVLVKDYNHLDDRLKLVEERVVQIPDRDAQDHVNQRVEERLQVLEHYLIEQQEKKGVRNARKR